MPAAKRNQTAVATSDENTMAESAHGFVTALIAQANDLERKRDTLQKLIGKNRDQLRNLDELGALDDDQGDWLEAFYPTKERGERRTPAEIESTRKVKVSARKGATGIEIVGDAAAATDADDDDGESSDDE